MNDSMSGLSAGTRNRRSARRTAARNIVFAAIAIIAAGLGWLAFSEHQTGATAAAGAPALPQVVVSKPLMRRLDTKMGFLGQFSAVEQVELRAQVGGTLTGIHFRDGAFVHKDDLLFAIDRRPYDIKLAQGNAQLESANARLALANRELVRAHTLKSSEAGTQQNVDQRNGEQQAAKAAVDAAKALISDAQFDIEHCRIAAPFAGRIGTHLVSIGNLVAGSRAATSPTTLLATMVSVDPIYLDFDMSESDYLNFQHARQKLEGDLASKVEIALGDETEFMHQGTLDFVDNALERSSGTIHVRATVSNADFLLTPGEFARVRVVIGLPVDTLLLPDAAVLPDQSRHLVLIVTDDGTVGAKEVDVGDLRGGLRVIRGGLSPSDRVIIDGLPYAAPGAKVGVKDGEIHIAAASLAE